MYLSSVKLGKENKRSGMNEFDCYNSDNGKRLKKIKEGTQKIL